MLRKSSIPALLLRLSAEAVKAKLLGAYYGVKFKPPVGESYA